MKVLLYSKHGQFPGNLEPLLKKFNFEILPPNNPHDPNLPDLVVTFGGDGTLIGAERDFPGTPKLPLKNSNRGHHTIPLEAEQTLKLLTENKLILKEYSKLEAKLSNDLNQWTGLPALNDVVIRNSLPHTALRFKVSSNQQLATSNHELIGDGLVISTPFGSSGYFYSITRKTFERGIGLAFNNIHNTNPTHQVLDENAEIEVKILRGPAVLAIDNNPDLRHPPPSAKIVVKRSPHVAKIYTSTRASQTPP